MEGAERLAHLAWLVHPLGHRWLMDGVWTTVPRGSRASLLSSTGNDADPLAHVAQVFREHLAECALYSLVTPGWENNGVVGPNRGSDG